MNENNPKDNEEDYRALEPTAEDFPSPATNFRMGGYAGAFLVILPIGVTFMSMAVAQDGLPLGFFIGLAAYYAIAGPIIYYIYQSTPEEEKQKYWEYKRKLRIYLEAKEKAQPWKKREEESRKEQQLREERARLEREKGRRQQELELAKKRAEIRRLEDEIRKAGSTDPEEKVETRQERMKRKARERVEGGVGKKLVWAELERECREKYAHDPEALEDALDEIRRARDEDALE